MGDCGGIKKKVGSREKRRLRGKGGIIQIPTGVTLTTATEGKGGLGRKGAGGSRDQGKKGGMGRGDQGGRKKEGAGGVR